MASAGGSQISATLNQIYGENVNKKFELKGSQVLIGRNFSANIRLENPSVSRKHCILNYTDKGWKIKDNKSQNGTWVCGQKLQPNESRLLECGDIIFLGPPAELPQAFCFEINYDSQSQLEFPAIETNEEKKDTSLGLDDSTDDPNQFCYDDFVQKKTPEKETSLTISDAEIVVISPEKNFSNETECESSEDLCTKPLSPPNGTFKRKIPITSEISSSQHSDSKKSKCIQPIPVNPQVLVSDIFNNINLRDQINEVSSTESDQMGDSQSLLDVKTEDIPDQSCQNKEELENKCQSKNSESELLKSKLSLMAKEIEKLRMQRSLVEKKYKIACQKKNEILKKQLAEQEELKEDLQNCKQKARNEIKKEIMEKFEEDLICQICTELLIKPTVLECSHTFCEYCIHEWKKKKNECPMCRHRIQSMTRVLTLEHFIDKTLETLTPEQRDKREELIKERLMAEQPKKTKKYTAAQRNGRRRAQSRRPPARIPNMEISPRRNLLLPIQFPSISYPLFIDNPNFQRIPEVIISDSELDTVNIYVAS